MPCKKRSGLMNDRRAYRYNVNVTTPVVCPIILDIDISTVNFSQNFTILACQRLTIATNDKIIPLGVTFINYGTVTYSGGVNGSLAVNGTFINYGTFNNTGNELYIGNNFKNYGTFNNGLTSTVTMGALSNIVIFNNTGVFNNLGGVYLLISNFISTFYNYSGGKFINSGTLIINSPEVFNNANGTGVCGSGIVTNTGTINGTIGTACPP
jgi:hypothetical protein